MRDVTVRWKGGPLFWGEPPAAAWPKTESVRLKRRIDHLRPMPNGLMAHAGTRSAFIREGEPIAAALARAKGMLR